MSAEIRKSTVAVNREVYNGKGQTVCQSDVIVPDSMPDSLKVLQVEGRAVQESAIIAKGKISVRGRVECDILYVPESARGVRTINHSIPFTYSENVADADENMLFEAECEVTHLEFQLVNSRKISIKAVVEIVGKVTGKHEICFVSSAEGDDAETRTKTFKGKNRLVCRNTEFDVSENIPLPKNAEKIIKTYGEIKSRDVKIINNKVVAKGEIGVHLMFCSGEEKLDCISTSVPFTEILDAEGISETQSTEVEYYLMGINAHTAEGENGKEARCTISVRVRICSDEIPEFEAVTDIYGTDKVLVPEKEAVRFEEYGTETVTKLELREIVAVEEDAPPISKVFSVQVKPYVSGCSETPVGVKTVGEAVCSVTYISEKEDSMVNTAVFNLPFTAMTESMGGGDYRASVRSGSAECSISGNNIELRIPLDVTVSNEKVTEAELVRDVKEQEEAEIDRPAMVLYFVQKGDTIWEVAKRYHSKIGDIERINKINGDELQEGMMLLIPKK